MCALCVCALGFVCLYVCVLVRLCACVGDGVRMCLCACVRDGVCVCACVRGHVLERALLVVVQVTSYSSNSTACVALTTLPFHFVRLCIQQEKYKTKK